MGANRISRRSTRTRRTRYCASSRMRLNDFATSSIIAAGRAKHEVTRQHSKPLAAPAMSDDDRGHSQHGTRRWQQPSHRCPPKPVSVLCIHKPAFDNEAITPREFTKLRNSLKNYKILMFSNVFPKFFEINSNFSKNMQYSYIFQSFITFS